ncbi:hypothetical protein H257_09782 [Aphanomyces astaci]|uniref:Transposase Tc1-like domain-containing protein n=1 Tax=Aphanomyces astaci TaxID=112090 RepID=W4G9D5_APHAT|nr:hypothetical protein H257_09782 [Aphanomyces astaci]ETV76317.1 hypothetical protein H257_09782 [Aphanomyces astaci]|eukprot:XP_009834442.1 hypothetical protein H257_09782 [Aphanomyces astaci]
MGLPEGPGGLWNEKEPRQSAQNERTRSKANTTGCVRGRSSSSRIQFDLDLDVSPRTVRRLLNKTTHFQYKKRKPTPRLTKAHKQARVEWAKDHVYFGTKWAP